MDREQFLSAIASGKTEFREIDFSEADFTGIHIPSTVTLDRCDFTRAKLKQSRIQCKEMIYCTLDEAHLYGAHINRVELGGTTGGGVRGGRSVWTNVTGQGFALTRSDLIDSLWLSPSLQGASFEGSQMYRSSWHRGFLKSVDFSWAALHNSEWTDTTLAGCYANNANFDSSRFIQCYMGEMEASKSRWLETKFYSHLWKDGHDRLFKWLPSCLLEVYTSPWLMANCLDFICNNFWGDFSVDESLFADELEKEVRENVRLLLEKVRDTPNMPDSDKAEFDIEKIVEYYDRLAEGLNLRPYIQHWLENYEEYASASQTD